MRGRFECTWYPLRQCLSYHEGNFQFVITLDVVAFHVTGYVIHRIYRIYRRSEILAIFLA